MKAHDPKTTDVLSVPPGVTITAVVELPVVVIVIDTGWFASAGLSAAPLLKANVLPEMAVAMIAVTGATTSAAATCTGAVGSSLQATNTVAAATSAAPERRIVREERKRVVMVCKAP
ncbi:MAG: hypothetical protein FJ202_00565 [Gemmatimonadetes bacterium]|nr:hypothetical protein [Gemmatimonadota bacterium]